MSIARNDIDENIDEAFSKEELKKKIEKGKLVRVYMIDEPEVEDYIKEYTNGATSRFIEDANKEGKCIHTGKKTKTIAYFAKSY